MTEMAIPDNKSYHLIARHFYTHRLIQFLQQPSILSVIITFIPETQKLKHIMVIWQRLHSLCVNA